MTDITSRYDLKIDLFNKKLSLAFSSYRKTTNKMASQSKRTTSKMTNDLRKYTRAIKSVGGALGGGWWVRFGKVAAGFTVAYRAINLMEAGLSRVSTLLQEAIVETGELASLQGKLAFWQRMHAKDVMSFADAYKAAGANVQALYEASFRSMSTLSELTTGMEEIAQTIGSVPPELIPQLVSVIDFTTLVAQTTGSTTRQIRQELQALTQGEMRTTNILIRAMKNIGVLTAKDISQLKQMNNQAEILRKVFNAIHTEWGKLAKELIRTDPTKAFTVWEKTARKIFIDATKAASAMKDVKNIFADVISTEIDRMLQDITDKDWARIAAAMTDLADALGWVLRLFPKLIKAVGYINQALKNLHPQLKKVQKWLWQIIKAGLVIKIFEKLTVVIVGLIAPLFQIVWLTGRLAISFAVITVQVAAFLVKTLALPAAIGAVIISMKALWDAVSRTPAGALNSPGGPGWQERFEALEKEEKLLKLQKDVREKTLARWEKEEIGKPSYALRQERVKTADAIDAWRDANTKLEKMKKELEDSLTSGEFESNKKAVKNYFGSFAENFKESFSEQVDLITGYWGDKLDGLKDKVVNALKEHGIDLTPKSVEEIKELFSMGTLKDLEKQMKDFFYEIGDIDGIDLNEFAKEWNETYLNLIENSKTFWETYLEDLQKNFEFMDALAEGIAKSMESSFQTFFFDAMTGELDSFEDYMRSFTNSILKMISDIMAKMLMMSILESSFGQAVGNFFKTGNWVWPSSGNVFDYTGPVNRVGSGQEFAGVAHTGGIVGSTRFDKRAVPSSLFNFAPRLHNGLRSDEFPAILQKGETVLPKGSSMSGMTNITIQALDAASFQEFMNRNTGALQGPMTRILQSSKGMRNTIRRVL